MSRGYLCSLTIPHLAFLYKFLDYFCIVHADIEKIFGPWFIVVGWLGVYFFQVHRSYPLTTRFSPAFVPCKASLSKVRCLTPSKLFWFRDQISVRPYHTKGDPAQIEIRDNRSISLKFFWTGRMSLQQSQYWHELHIIGEFCCPTRFYSQSGFGQHILDNIDPSAWGKLTVTDVHTRYRECLRRQTQSSLESPLSMCNEDWVLDMHIGGHEYLGLSTKASMYLARCPRR